jgi:hypothetical protein
MVSAADASLGEVLAIAIGKHLADELAASGDIETARRANGR